MLVLPIPRLLAADDDFVICRQIAPCAPCAQVLVFPSGHLLHHAADDSFVICQTAPHGKVLVLPSRRLVRPAAHDDFVTLFQAIILWNL